MIPYERHELILDTLKTHDLVKIDELQALMPSVSLSTLRRDLKELEKRGNIEYLAGGAVKLHEAQHEVNISIKSTLNSAQKSQIAHRAASEIKDGDVIYIDSGSTCSALFPLLFNRPLTIYTTNASACAKPAGAQANVIVVGGVFNPITSSFTGPVTEEILKSLYFDKVFLGCNAIDEERGVMTPGFSEASKKRLVKSNAQMTYVLCDSSKFHGFSNVKVFDLDGIVVISDKFDSKIGERARILLPE